MDISCAHDVPAELYRTEPICAGGCGRRTYDSDYALCADCRDAGPVEEPTAADFLSPNWPLLRDAIEADRKDPK